MEAKEALAKHQEMLRGAGREREEILENLRRSLIISDGSWLVFVERPIALTMLALSVIALGYPLIRVLLGAIIKPRGAGPG